MNDIRITVAEIAEQTGWSVQKVRNAARKLGFIQESQQGRTLSFSQDQTQVLANYLGNKNYTTQKTHNTTHTTEFVDVSADEKTNTENQGQVNEADVVNPGSISQRVFMTLDEYTQLHIAQNTLDTYHEQLKLSQEHVAELNKEIGDLRDEIDRLKEELQQALIENAMYKSHTRLSLKERLLGRITVPLLPERTE